jgi:hypothetical protein
MNRTTRNSFVVYVTVVLLAPLAALHAADKPAKRAAKIELLTLSWFFNAAQPAQSTLAAQPPQAEFAAPSSVPVR